MLSCKLSRLHLDTFGNPETDTRRSCLSGNGAKDVAEVLLTLKDKKWADRLDWQVAQ